MVVRGRCKAGRDSCRQVVPPEYNGACYGCTCSTERVAPGGKMEILWFILTGLMNCKVTDAVIFDLNMMFTNANLKLLYPT